MFDEGRMVGEGRFQNVSHPQLPSLILRIGLNNRNMNSRYVHSCFFYLGQRCWHMKSSITRGNPCRKSCRVSIRVPHTTLGCFSESIRFRFPGCLYILSPRWLWCSSPSLLFGSSFVDTGMTHVQINCFPLE
jgi:hypothetical protein